jgi:hypothetical protein
MHMAMPSEAPNLWPKRCAVIFGKALAIAIIGTPLAAMLFPDFGGSANRFSSAAHNTASMQSFGSGPALNPISFQRSDK